MSVTFYANYIHAAGFVATAEPTITGEGWTASGGETDNGAEGNPAYDLVDNKTTAVITIDTNGESSDPIIDIDCTANIINADFVIIDASNFNTANADVDITASGGAVTLSSAYQGVRGSAMTVCSGGDPIADTSDDGADGIILLNFDEAVSSDQNFEINISTSTTYAADVTIGEIAVGVICATTYSANVNPLHSYKYQGVDVSQSAGGQRYATKRYGKQRAWRLSFDMITDTDKTNLETMFDVVDGMHHPFWIDFGEADTPQLYFVRFMQDSLNFQKQTHALWTLSIEVEEEL
jgi:hypothetical protein